MPRVLCAGHVNWDVTLYVDGLPEVDGEARVRSRRAGGGGSAANVASVLVDLGVETGLVGSVGDDDPGRRARRELADRGVDLDGLRVVEDGVTTEKYLVVDPDGSAFVLGREGVNEAIGPADVRDGQLAGVEHFHLTGQRPETAAALADIAAEAGASTSVDPGRRVAERDFAPVFDRVDLVFVNESEAESLGQDAVPAETLLVITTGEGGATARVEDDRYDHRGFHARNVDETGAGDAFAAGFLATWLDGSAVDVALAVGNACGAIATERRGARVEVDPDRVDSMRRAEPGDP